VGASPKNRQVLGQDRSRASVAGDEADDRLVAPLTSRQVVQELDDLVVRLDPDVLVAGTLEDGGLVNGPAFEPPSALLVVQVG
jgi:hypothetical protein